MVVYKPWVGDKFQIVEMRMKYGIGPMMRGYVDTMFDSSFFYGVPSYLF
jgi:hypothetical protein